MTEDELIELLTLTEFRLDDELTELSDEDGIDYIKENGMWSNEPTVGEKYVAFKTISGKQEQEIFLPISWETQGMEDRDGGVHPFHIQAGFIFSVYGDVLKPLKTIEWFLKKGFKVGDLALINSTK